MALNHAVDEQGDGRKIRRTSGSRRFAITSISASTGADDDFYLFLQKQQPSHRYIPIGYVPPGDKESTCDDATIMSLLVL